MTTVVITGASSGLGALAARTLHDRGMKVVVVGRDAARTAAVADELGVDRYTADFCRLADVQRLADALGSKYSRIDVLAANAGGIPPKGQTADAVDGVFQANALAPWLLMTLLGDHLSVGRIVATSSQTHERAVIDKDNVGQLAGALGGRGRLRAYARAKLVGAILLREFGRRHTDIDVGDFHPGVLATDFSRYLGRAGGLVKAAGRLVLEKPQDGADRLVELVTASDPLAGRYFVKGQPQPGSAQLHDLDLAERLWTLATELTDVGGTDH